MAALPQAGSAQPVPAATTAPVKLPEWDVVSVKPVQNCSAGSGMQVTKDGVHVFCLAVRSLVQIAWRISEPSRILDVPSWASDQTYEIDAKVDGDDVAAFGKLSGPERNQMLQALLRDRFKLKAHLDTRELPVYELVVAKGGSKLKEATPAEAAQPMMRMRSRGEIDSVSMSLGSLPSLLSRELDRPVVDKTGLKGNYDFTLQFAPAVGSPPDSEAPSIFTAIEEQLGLRLQTARAPMDVLVIDSVERPAEN
jgi:uncharacterized protein (TIGR03435 family)